MIIWITCLLLQMLILTTCLSSFRRESSLLCRHLLLIILAVALKSKDTKVKSMALPSALSACMGITEPAIFGVNLRYFKPFLGGLLGGACGALYASIVGLGATGTGVTGIFGILLHLHMPLQYIIMMAISFGVSFAVTWVIWSPEEVKA